jgi:hypothetical protein
MVDLINVSNSIGAIVTSGTGLTGSLEATLIMIFVLLVAMCMMFGIPLEFASVILLPFLIAVGAYHGSFYLIISFIILWLGFITVKNWIFR